MNSQYKSICNTVRLVSFANGLYVGLSFIYGLFFFERLGGESNPNAIYLTTVLFVLGRVLVLATDVPTGIFADHYGRKKALILSFVCVSIYFFFLGLLCFVSSWEWAFGFALVCRMFSCLGLALQNGSLLAWIVDTHRETQSDQTPSSIISDSTKYQYIGEIIGTTLTLTLYIYNHVFYAFSLGCIATLVAAIYCLIVMEEKRAGHSEAQERKTKTFGKMIQDMRFVAKCYVQYPAIFFVSLIFSLFAFINNLVSYLWPVALKVNYGFGKLSFVWYVLVCLSLVFGLLGNKIFSKWIYSHFSSTKNDIEVENLRIWFVIGSIISVLPIIALGIGTKLGSVSLILLVVAVLGKEGSYGFIKPAYQILVNKYIPVHLSKYRATILSMGSTLVSVIAILIGIPSGGPSGQLTAVGWMIPAIILIVTAIIGNFVMKRGEKVLPNSDASGVTVAEVQQ